MAATLGIALVSVGVGLFALRFKQRREQQRRTPSAGRQTQSYDLRAGTDTAVQIDPLTEQASSESYEQVTTRQKTGHVLACSVMASPGTQYEGYELLQALLTNGMRFGERSLFHRYEGAPGSGKILFSLASVKNPGTFDLPKMGEFKTPGLMLFTECDEQDDPQASFELMTQTAKRLADTLGGDLCDQHRQPVREAEFNHEHCLV